MASRQWSNSLGVHAIYLVPYYGLNFYLAVNHFLPNAVPILPISINGYDRYQLLFALPVRVIAWFLFSGTS
jgi:hypothetical protein